MTTRIVADEAILLGERVGPALFAGGLITAGVENWQTG